VLIKTITWFGVRCARRCSQAAINRRRKLSLCSAPKNLRLYDFIKKRNSKPPSSTSGVNLRLGSVSVSVTVLPFFNAVFCDVVFELLLCLLVNYVTLD